MAQPPAEITQPLPTRRGRARRKAYLPGLDGLRAIAVLAVCLFHFEVPGTAGGFLGVDVFFVLSGYLITSQLWTRWSDGPIRLWPFWQARIRRLFPAVLVTLLFTSVAMVFWDRPGVRQYLGDLAAAATYTSNWWYVADQRSYAVQWGLVRPPALQHLWSLAVEEQFYLLWPLVIALGVWATRRTRHAARVLAVPVLIGAIASALWMGLGSAAEGVPDPMNPAADPMRWYYGTDSHSMGLLLGAALALWRGGAGFGRTAAGRDLPALRPAGTVVTVLGALGLLGIVSAVGLIRYEDVWLYRAGFAAVALATLLAVIAATRAGPLATVLAWPVLRYLGTRSYSIYLWHWPIVCFTRPGQDLDWPHWQVLVLRAVATLAASELSYRLVETPVRRSGFRASLRWLNRRWLAAPLVAACLAVVTATVAVGLVTRERTTEDAIRQEIRTTDFQDEVVLPPSQTATAPPATKTPSASRPARPPTTTTPPPRPPAKPVSTKTLDVTYYGDSFAVGAVPGLREVFRSVDLHAAVSRQADAVLGEVQQDAGVLTRRVVVIHTGNNGVIGAADLKAALAALRTTRRVVVVLPYTPRPWTEQARAEIVRQAGTPEKPKLRNVRVVDWASLATAHPSYLIEDKVHPTSEGIAAYTKLVQVAAVRP